LRYIVTGGGGFIGSHLVDLLLEKPDTEHVHVIDPRQHVWTSPKVTMHTYTVQEMAKTIWSSIDGIFHLAGHVGPTGVLQAAGQIAIDTLAMADIVKHWSSLNNDCPIVFTSTSEVYGSPDSANKESDNLVFYPQYAARREYAAGKFAAENALLPKPASSIIIRPFNVAGPRQRPDGGFVLPRFVRQALQGTGLTVYKPGNQKRTFTHVRDLVDGIWLAFSRPESRGQVFNLGNEENVVTMDELAELVIKTVGNGHIERVNPVDLHGFGFKEAPEKTADSRKARMELKWEPSRSLEDIVSDTVWYWRNVGV
jgi:UDP-glucose 4-epimerase